MPLSVALFPHSGGEGKPDRLLARKKRFGIASPYSQRLDTVEPVFGNIQHNRRLIRLNHQGHIHVNTKWNRYCMVHNTEKLAKTNLGHQRDK